MDDKTGQVTSFLAQRIRPAPSEVRPPSPRGRGVVIQRYREGVIDEPRAREELLSLGWSGPEIERAITEARLTREFDTWTDTLKTLQEAYEKDLITYEELKVQLLKQIRDPAKARVLLDLWEFTKQPKPSAPQPEEVRTLTVSQLLAAYRAGILVEPVLRSELASRHYDTTDINIMLALEAAKAPKPKAPTIKLMTLADLRASFALGLLTAAEYQAVLIERNHPPDEAARLVGLELARIEARLPKPKPEEYKLIPVGDLRAMLSFGILTPSEFIAAMLQHDYSPADAQLELELELARAAPPAAPPTP